MSRAVVNDLWSGHDKKGSRARLDTGGRRAGHLAESALRAREPWTRALGLLPHSPQQALVWRRQVQIVAAYRDRCAVTGNGPLGARAESIAQRGDAAHAANALARAQQSATELMTSRIAASPRREERSGPRL